MEQIHDYLMEAYYSVRYNQPLEARRYLGCAAALIRKLEPTPELKNLFWNIHYIRDSIEALWPQTREHCMERVSGQVRKVSEWRIA